MLKAAFVQGRLTKDEFDTRVGQALASRTHGDLAAVTADIPAGVAGGQPPRTPARGRTRKPINTVKEIAWGACVICALGVVGVAAAILISSPYLLLLSGLAFIGASAVAWGVIGRGAGAEAFPRAANAGASPWRKQSRIPAHSTCRRS